MMYIRATPRWETRDDMAMTPIPVVFVFLSCRESRSISVRSSRKWIGVFGGVQTVQSTNDLKFL